MGGLNTMIKLVVILLIAGVTLLALAPGDFKERLSDMGLALVVSAIVFYASYVRDERPETNKRVFKICVILAIVIFTAIVIIKAYVGGISVDITHWGLIISGIGILATIIVAVLIYHWTRRRTDEILEFTVNLIVNSAGDPDTVRRLLDDYEKTGEWRGKVTREKSDKIHIAWEP